MLSHKFNENLSSKIYQEYSSKIHKQRLKQIKHRQNLSLNLSSDPRPKVVKKLARFISVEKFKEIRRENKILYEKLTSIAERKHGKDSPPLANFPKTLNFTNRKRQMERIAKENLDLIQRIIERPSHFSIQKLRDEYDMKQKYKENISKKKILDKIQQLVKNHPMEVLLEEPAGSDNSPENRKKKFSMGAEDYSGKSQKKLEQNEEGLGIGEERLRDKLKKARIKVRQSENNLGIVSIKSLSNEENLIASEDLQKNNEGSFPVNLLEKAQELIKDSLNP